MNYLTTIEVMAIHQELIDLFGGTHGIRDQGALEAAIFRPQSGYYNDLIHEAAAFMESLAMNHPFLDGNKRVAFFGTDVFLRLNGYHIESNNVAAYEYLMGLFDKGAFDAENLREWLTLNVVTLQ